MELTVEEDLLTVDGETSARERGRMRSAEVQNQRGNVLGVDKLLGRLRRRQGKESMSIRTMSCLRRPDNLHLVSQQHVVHHALLADAPDPRLVFDLVLDQVGEDTEKEGDGRTERGGQGNEEISAADEGIHSLSGADCIASDVLLGHL